MKKTIEWSRILFDKIRERAVKFALFKIFGRVIGGVWGWLATEIGERLFTKLISPLYKWAVRKLYTYRKAKEIKKKAKKLEEAKNEQEFDDRFDDLP